MNPAEAGAGPDTGRTPHHDGEVRDVRFHDEYPPPSGRFIDGRRSRQQQGTIIDSAPRCVFSKPEIGA